MAGTRRFNVTLELWISLDADDAEAAEERVLTTSLQEMMDSSEFTIVANLADDTMEIPLDAVVVVE